MRSMMTALLIGGFLAAGLYGQNQPAAPAVAPAVYRVEFVIHDANEPAAKAGRHYALLIESGGKGTLKVGNRVAITMANGQFNYIDVGTNIDCRLHGGPERVELTASMDMSTVLPRISTGPAAPSSPTVSQLRIDVDANLEPGKRATVASIQDPITQRDVDVEATVTKVR